MVNTMEGLIFNIQRYSLNDGDGIRTIVFFKGCTLRCPWCSNPESLNYKIERVKDLKKCIHCTKCYENIDDCPTGSHQDIGCWITAEKLIEEIKKDSIFYDECGGVTFSGGEALLQSEFLRESSKKMKEQGINTALETSGHISFEKFKEGIEYIDQILFDIKILDESKFKNILKGNLNLVLTNLNYLIKIKKDIIIRYPYIPGYTDDDENVNKILKLCKELKIKNLHILPYHNYGVNKYSLVGIKYELDDVKIPSDDKIESIKNYFEQQNIKIKIKG